MGLACFVLLSFPFLPCCLFSGLVILESVSFAAGCHDRVGGNSRVEAMWLVARGRGVRGAGVVHKVGSERVSGARLNMADCGWSPWGRLGKGR